MNSKLPSELWAPIASFFSLLDLPPLLVLSKSIHAILSSLYVWRTRLRDLVRNSDPDLSSQVTFYGATYPDECDLRAHSKKILQMFNRPLEAQYFNQGFYMTEDVALTTTIDPNLSIESNKYSYSVEVDPPREEFGKGLKKVSFQTGTCYQLGLHGPRVRNRRCTGSILRVGNVVSFHQIWDSPRGFVTCVCGHGLPSGDLQGSWCDTFFQRGLFHMCRLSDEEFRDGKLWDMSPNMGDLSALKESHPRLSAVRDDFLLADERTVYEWEFFPTSTPTLKISEEVLFQNPNGLFVLQKKSIRRNFIHGLGFSLPTKTNTPLHQKAFKFQGTVHLEHLSGTFITLVGSRCSYCLVRMPPMPLSSESELMSLAAEGLVYGCSGVVGRLRLRIARGDHLAAARSYLEVLERVQELQALEESLQ